MRLIRGRFIWQGVFGDPVFEPIALTGDLDNLGMVQKAVQDGGGAGHIADQFAPILQGAIGGHHSGFSFIPSHDDFKKVLAGSLGLYRQIHPIK